MSGYGADREHWERAWRHAQETPPSWAQAEPEPSLRLILSALARNSRILDVGGGASRLVDRLLDAGYARPGVLDVSAVALAVARERLGERSTEVEWFHADVRSFESPHAWDLWHDRAVFHFLTEPADRAAYRAALRRALAPGGQVIVATFALTGPERCSGLPTVRYDCDTLGAELGEEFELVESALEAHRTPAGKTQDFVYCRFRRR